jgi:chromatin remodeling complex protein RSC6
MARQSKSASASAPATTNVPVTVAVEVSAPVVEKKQRKPKAVAPVAEAPAPVVEAPAPVAETPVAEAPATEDTASSTSSKFAALVSIVKEMNVLNRNANLLIKEIEKSHTKDIKTASKNGRKRRGPGNRKPAGFITPILVSDELAKFLGKEAGAKISRVEVTQGVNAYIREHNLKDAKNGRKINPDAKLKKLLKVQDGEDLTFFNLQRYLKSHFLESVKSA